MPDDSRIDFTALAERARRMQSDLTRVEKDLASAEATGYADGGLVTATVSGEGRILDLRIDPSVIDPDDPETLARLTIAAIEEANQALAEQRAQRVGDVVEGVGGLIAGLRANPLGKVVPIFPNRAGAPAAGHPEQGAS